MNTRTKIIASFLVSCQILATAFAGETVEMTIDTAIAVSWQSELNKNYRILTSTDLKNWTVANPSVQGDGTTITRLFPKEAETAFYRVEETGQPTWLEGEWSGVASQDADYEEWYDNTVRFDSATGDFGATYVAPLGTCRTTWTLLSIDDDTAAFTETAAESGCLSGSTITITRLSEDSVLYVARYPGDPSLPALVHTFAVLTRQ